MPNAVGPPSTPLPSPQASHLVPPLLSLQLTAAAALRRRAAGAFPWQLLLLLSPASSLPGAARQGDERGQEPVMRRHAALAKGKPATVRMRPWPRPLPNARAKGHTPRWQRWERREGSEAATSANRKGSTAPTLLALRSRLLRVMRDAQGSRNANSWVMRGVWALCTQKRNKTGRDGVAGDEGGG